MTRLMSISTMQTEKSSRATAITELSEWERMKFIGSFMLIVIVGGVPEVK